jgi:hypothetical protein
MSTLARQSCQQPVAIGGVGGSGTRLISEILLALKFYLGDDLNCSGDNLWFTLLFKRPELLEFGALTDDDFKRSSSVFYRVMAEGGSLTSDEELWIKTLASKDRVGHPASWLQDRAHSLILGKLKQNHSGHWGWKEPNTHIFLDRLEKTFPGIKYIHVMRNGLDMAYSTNQNQLRLWAPFFFGAGSNYKINPYWALKYWCCVHRRVFDMAYRMQGRLLILNYDHFCSSPESGLRELLRFLGLTVSESLEDVLLSLVHFPDSIGRYRRYGLKQFDCEDIEYVNSLGFDTGIPICETEKVFGID